MSDAALDALTRPRAGAAGGSVRDYIELLKPRVMFLVVFTGFAGLMAAPGALHPVLGVVAVLCIAIAAGAAGAVNMWYDRDIDAVMERTRMRPLPTGRIAPSDALAFGIVLTLFAIMVMGLALNWVAALLLGLASAFYIFVYTIWLKRRTPQNIVIGGAAGAFPPMIGWAAVTGGVDLSSIVLFALIFMWTPPHFWALALYRETDYGRVGIPMLPNVAGARHTKWQMLAYTIVLVPLTVAPYWLGIAGAIYAVLASVLAVLFVMCAVSVLREDGLATKHRAAKRMFAFSLLHLFLLFVLLVVDGTHSPLAHAVGGLAG